MYFITCCKKHLYVVGLLFSGEGLCCASAPAKNRTGWQKYYFFLELYQHVRLKLHGQIFFCSNYWDNFFSYQIWRYRVFLQYKAQRLHQVKVNYALMSFSGINIQKLLSIINHFYIIISFTEKVCNNVFCLICHVLQYLLKIAISNALYRCN